MPLSLRVNPPALRRGQVGQNDRGRMSYCGELTKAMNMLAEDPGTIFVGQGVGVPSTAMTDTLRGVPEDRRLEFPVAEDLQLGFCIGLALTGHLPICIYPRW